MENQNITNSDLESSNNQIQNQPQPQHQFGSTINQPTEKKKRFSTTVGIVFFIILIAAAFYAFKAFSKPNLSELVFNTLDYYNSTEIRSGELAMEVDIDLSSLSGSTGNGGGINSSLPEMFGTIDDLKIKASYNMKWETGEDESVIVLGSAKIEVNSETADFFKMFGSQKAELSVMIHNDGLYLKLDSVPPMFAEIPLGESFTVNNLTNQWYQIPFEMASQMFGIKIPGMGAELLDDDQKAQVKMFLEKDRVFTIEKESSINIEGLGRVQELSISTDWMEFAQTTINISEMYGFPMNAAERAEITRMAQQVSESSVEDILVSIYVKDGIIQGLGASVDLYDPNTNVNVGTLDFKTTSRNINQKFNLTKPTEVKSIMELILKFL